ncbi:MAG: hypothetical protein R3240_07440 [Gammaproteobacteria bacterium]|nr:hypothetical protein [Gammaproteobacteria bacterium]
MTNASAKLISIPFFLDHALIERILLEQAFTTKNGALRLNDDGSGCQFLELRNPRVSKENSLLRVRTNTHAKIGRAFGENCLLLMEWKGQTDFYETVKLAKHGKVLIIKVVRSRLLTEDGHIDETTNNIWQWVNQDVAPIFDAVKVDLKEPIALIKQSLASWLHTNEAKQVNKALDSLRIRDIKIMQNGVKVLLRFQLPDTLLAKKKSEPGLNQKEITRLKENLDALNRYVAFIVNNANTKKTPEAVRFALIDVMLELRQRVLDILAQPKIIDPDPVRTLFRETWVQLAPLVREVARHQDSQAKGIQYLTFISANDALLALDKVGPNIGLDISTHGLRRLARLINQNPSMDPLKLKN